MFSCIQVYVFKLWRDAFDYGSNAAVKMRHDVAPPATYGRDIPGLF